MTSLGRNIPMPTQRESRGLPVKPSGLLTLKCAIHKYTDDQLNNIARHMGIPEDGFDKFREQCRKRVAAMNSMILRPPTGDSVTDKDRDAVIDAFVTAVFNGPSLINGE